MLYIYIYTCVFHDKFEWFLLELFSIFKGIQQFIFRSCVTHILKSFYVVDKSHFFHKGQNEAR